MSNVINFPGSEGDDLLYCPECGSGWFTVQCVNPRRDHTVNAVMGPMACRECGWVAVSGTWFAPSLAAVDDNEARR